jgi:hypothetical protein
MPPFSQHDRSTFLPEGPTTVTYTWTYPSTQTQTVVYGGPGWTTYREYSTVDGTRVIKTVVAPTRSAVSGAVSAVAPAEEKKDCLWIILLVVMAAMLAFGALVSDGETRVRGVKTRERTRRVREETTRKDCDGGGGMGD